MLEGEKNNLQAHTPKKKFHCESRCWKKISRPDQIPHPPPPPPSEVKWSAPYNCWWLQDVFYVLSVISFFVQNNGVDR